MKTSLPDGSLPTITSLITCQAHLRIVMISLRHVSGGHKSPEHTSVSTLRVEQEVGIMEHLRKHLNVFFGKLAYCQDSCDFHRLTGNKEVKSLEKSKISFLSRNNVVLHKIFS